MSNKNTLTKPEIIIPANAEVFETASLRMFGYQYQNNDIYHQYCNALHINTNTVKRLTDIPFLPISFFKTHVVKTGSWANDALLFESSSTTGSVTSKHHVRDATLYEAALLHGFRQYYGQPDQYAILALLPSYLERKNASLVYMAKVLMQHSAHADNGFYINEWQALHDKLQQLTDENKKIILLGVTFALLDFADAYPMNIENTIVMETGGMKGRREEWTRKQVHDFLKERWHVSNIHSEYGMTELLSQGYSSGDGIYECTDTMRVFIRDINDPLEVNVAGSGCINIIDLANVDSCAFIATEDIGNVFADGRFEILGRMDHSALRGCSLMAI